MYLSELYGRIGQILKEHGDMEIVRFRSLRMGDIIRTNSSNFVNYSSEDFTIYKSYVQQQIDENQVEEKLIGKHFIINIPFS